MRLSRNVAANFAGRGWTALTSIAFAPVYIQLMGVEAFGLIGFFLALLALSSLLELGLSGALTRELARLSASEAGAGEAREVVRTLEVVYWALAALIGVGVAAASSLIATDWFESNTLGAQTTRAAVLLMGVTLVFQWPIALYTGGLIGVQRLVPLNVLVVGMVTVRHVASVVALLVFTPTVVVFFMIQAAATALQALLTRILLMRSLSSPRRRVRFDPVILRRLWRFAAGMSGISALAVVLTQMDKVVLSKALSLRDFGYYSVAALVSSGFVYVFVPVFQAVYPRLTQLAAAGEDEALSRTYHRACQLVAVLAISLGAIVVTFSADILERWTNDTQLADQTHVIVSLLVTGTVLNGLMNIPYALMLAHGWTRLPLLLNVGAVVLFVPLLLIGVDRFGAEGAAAVWVAVNLAYLIVGVPLMHRRLLPSEMWKWLVDDVLRPGAAAVGVVLLVQIALPVPSSTAPAIAAALGITMMTLAASAIMSPAGLAWARSRLAPQ